MFVREPYFYQHPDGYQPVFPVDFFAFLDATGIVTDREFRYFVSPAADDCRDLGTELEARGFSGDGTQ